MPFRIMGHLINAMISHLSFNFFFKSYEIHREMFVVHFSSSTIVFVSILARWFGDVEFLCTRLFSFQSVWSCIGGESGIMFDYL